MLQVLIAMVLSLVLPGRHAVAEPVTPEADHYVILLHGLARSERSMRTMQDALAKDGFATCNIAYPSTEYPIDVLLREHVLPAIRACLPPRDVRVSFVTHSMGGILVRLLMETEPLPNIDRVVMLSPPNHGSEVVDRLGGLWLYRAVNGPAGAQLGTGVDSLPRKFGPARFPVGVITGDRTVNPFLSWLIPGDDDGKVSVESARLEGMQDFIVIATSHPFIMGNADAVRQTLAFLKTGRFVHPVPSADS